MTDIVERLRHGCSCNFPDTPCGAEEECRAAFDAADEITTLRAENERLRAALQEVKPLVLGANHSETRYPKACAALDAQPAPGKEE